MKRKNIFLALKLLRVTSDYRLEEVVFKEGDNWLLNKLENHFPGNFLRIIVACETNFLRLIIFQEFLKRVVWVWRFKNSSEEVKFIVTWHNKTIKPPPNTLKFLQLFLNTFSRFLQITLCLFLHSFFVAKLIYHFKKREKWGKCI